MLELLRDNYLTRFRVSNEAEMLSPVDVVPLQIRTAYFADVIPTVLTAKSKHHAVSPCRNTGVP